MTYSSFLNVGCSGLSLDLVCHFFFHPLSSYYILCTVSKAKNREVKARQILKHVLLESLGRVKKSWWNLWDMGYLTNACRGAMRSTTWWDLRLHSMVSANLNKSFWLVINTPKVSKYIPRRTRISINWNPLFQTSLHKIFKNCFLWSKSCFTMFTFRGTFTK